jgi:hypothetical protein
MRARYYDPGTGGFLSQDTWTIDRGNPVELNRYGYVAGNPVNYVDPSGHVSIDLGFNKANISAKASAGLSALGATLKLVGTEVMIWISIWGPRLASAICVIGGFVDGVDFGPQCEGPARLFLATVGNPLRRVVEIVRIGLDQAGRDDLRINHAIASIVVDGVEHLIYAVSGKHNADLEDQIASTGLNLARFRLPQLLDEATDSVLPQRLVASIENRVADTEIKILQYALDEFIIGKIGQGSTVSVTLFTEIVPCESCGGSNGLGGVILQFRNIVEGLGGRATTDILYAFQSTAEKRAYWKGR